MQSVLILTKNVLFDKNLQDNLMSLNFEVFTSCTLLERILKKKSSFKTLNFFQWIVLSSTLKSQEVEHLLFGPLSSYVGGEIVRSDFLDHDVSQRDRLERMGVSSWIKNTDTLSQLCKVFINGSNTYSKASGIHSNEKEIGTEKCLLPTNIQNFKNSLEMRMSIQEILILELLLREKNLPVSKNDIVNKVWPGENIDKKNAQMSIIVRNMKQKIYDTGFFGQTIRTVRGIGYVMDQGLYELLNCNSGKGS